MAYGAREPDCIYYVGGGRSWDGEFGLVYTSTNNTGMHGRWMAESHGRNEK